MASGYLKTWKKYSKDEEEFQEQDVWGNSMEGLKPKPLSSSSSTPRMIPRKEKKKNHPSKEYKKRSSAPLTIPDRQMKNGSSWADVNGNGDDHDDGEDDEIVPPHEYIARRLARTQISSFSVCEGVGRKLKGRDLSEVRNDVLRKTGFLET